jgi:signal transduction histidine kinase
VSWALCWLGWTLAVAAAMTLRRRMALVADAEHELRGAAIAIGLVAERSPAVSLQIDRMHAALIDLAAARGASPPASPELEAGRLAQVLANVSANAAEHGVGPVRVEVSNERGARRAPAAGRGRGLQVAKRAARELGGRVAVISEDGETRAVIELPARDERRRAA